LLREGAHAGIFQIDLLFDPVADNTRSASSRSTAVSDRIIGMRINVLNERGTPRRRPAGVRNRDLRHPNMKKTWKKLADLGLSRRDAVAALARAGDQGP